MLATAEKIILAYPTAKSTFLKSGHLDQAKMFGMLQDVNSNLAQVFAVNGQVEFVNSLVEIANLQQLKAISAVLEKLQPIQDPDAQQNGFLSNVTKEDVKQAVKESKAIDIIKNYLKTFFAKRKVAEIR